MIQPELLILMSLLVPVCVVSSKNLFKFKIAKDNGAFVIVLDRDWDLSLFKFLDSNVEVEGSFPNRCSSIEYLETLACFKEFSK